MLNQPYNTVARRNNRLEIGITITTGSANEGKCHALCNKQTPAVGVKRRVRPADRLMAAACGGVNLNSGTPRASTHCKISHCV